MFYNLKANHWNEEEMKSLLKVLRAGAYEMGEEVAQFETQFIEKLGTRYAVMTNSGSSAALMGIAALFYKKDRPLKRGDEVIVPALSWATTLAPLQLFGLNIKIVDVELTSLNIDLSQLEKAVTPKTKMVLSGHTMGNPAGADSVKAFCKRLGIYYFEDCSQGLGADVKGKKAGTFGDIGIYSFSHGGIIDTMEGGMLCTEDKEIYHLAKSLRQYGMAKAVPAESPLFNRTDDTFFEECRILFPGFNMKPLNICGTIGKEQLKKLEGTIEIKRQNATMFQENFSGDTRFILQREVGKSAWQGFSLILNPQLKANRKTVVKALKDNDIETAPILNGCIAKQDVMKLAPFSQFTDLRVANLVHENGFYVGNSSHDMSRQFERFHKVVTMIVGGSAAMFKRAA